MACILRGSQDEIVPRKSIRKPARPNDSIRDRRRRELIEATITVIARHGYAGTTVARVAKEARLSVGLMNFHFKSKDILFDETFRFISTEYDGVWREATAKVKGAPPAVRLKSMIEAYFDPRIFTHRKLAVWFAFWSDANLRDRYRALVLRVERRYSRELERTLRELAKGHDIAVAGAAVMGTSLTAAIDGLWLQFMLDPKSANRQRAVKTCLGLLEQWFPRSVPA
ncbi:TetR family transcriptional regulator [Hypericibacter adhaerens]|uniref:TetR family transcriptional regulator n=1 Tax=Hypericibacter adhaerens TaxID=2602016 RepID=A0A5J6N2G3_9PROT|nr:TetR family transcriptional regulator [Hypericibacter adhaerens]